VPYLEIVRKRSSARRRSGGFERPAEPNATACKEGQAGGVGLLKVATSGNTGRRNVRIEISSFRTILVCPFLILFRPILLSRGFRSHSNELTVEDAVRDAVSGVGARESEGGRGESTLPTFGGPVNPPGGSSGLRGRRENDERFPEEPLMRVLRLMVGPRSF
jgi:hypothetical protein